MIGSHAEIKGELMAGRRDLGRLRELVFQMEQVPGWPHFKELLTPIDHFLILFSPDDSYHLYRLWSLAHQKFNMDPV